MLKVIKTSLKQMESISAENRNQMPTPLNRSRQPQTIRRCSLCRQPGHNILRCNSERMLEFEAICANAVVNINNPDDFQNWLRQNYANELLLLKAFVIRKLSISRRLSLNEYIHYIAEYIFRTYKNQAQTEVSEEDDTLPPLIEANINEVFEENFNNVITNLTTIYNYEVTEDTNLHMSIIMRYTQYLLYLFRLLPNREYYLEDQNQKTIILSIENNDENLDETCQCSICWDDKELRQFVKLDCNHEFCKDCIRQSVPSETRTSLHCALCRGEVRTMRLRTQEAHTELLEILA
jgi:hypothetical protein